MKLIGTRHTEIYDLVENAAVFDTHTHLDSSSNVAAETPWDILHYFWFKRELIAAGYPEHADELDEYERRIRFLDAFEKSRNTYWNTIARRMLSDLFDLTLERPASFDEFEEKLAKTSVDPEWPVTVCDRLAVRNIVVGHRAMNVSASFGERLIVVPNYSLSERMRKNGVARTDADSDVADLVAMGHRTIRVDLDPYLNAADLSQTEEVHWERMLARLNDERVRIQVFSGMKRDRKPHTMLNDPQRIIRLYPLFDRYTAIDFEIINAAAGDNLDVLQAARVFPNVHPGGLWWFNFRASTYQGVFQQRFEALPTNRSTIVASDARCIEWLYGKVLLIKSLLARFLDQQMASGWTDLEGAGRAADDWLFNSAIEGYMTKPTD